MFTKIKTKMQKMTWKDWLQTGLWSSVLVFLLTFVILAATLTKTSTKIENVKAEDTHVTNKVFVAGSTVSAKTQFVNEINNDKPNTILNSLKNGSTVEKPLYNKALDAKLIYIKNNGDVTNPIWDLQNKNRTLKLVNGKVIAITGFALPKNSDKPVWRMEAHNILKTTEKKSYDNALASLGAVFTISIFGALGTTVGFKFLERKRGKN